MNIDSDLDRYINLGLYSSSVAISGYYWDEKVVPAWENHLNKEKWPYPNRKGPFLLPVNPAIGYKVINPLDECPEMLGEFADLEGSPESFLSFANKYGQLTSSIEVGDPDKPVPSGDYPGLKYEPINHSDSLSFWSWEHRWVKTALRIWEYLNTGDTKRLKSMFHWVTDRGKERVIYIISRNDSDQHKVDNALVKQILHKPNERNFFQIWMIGTALHSNDPIFSKVPYGDVTIPAKLFLQGIINKKIGEYPSLPVLMLNESNQSVQKLKSSNLLGALWLQFLQLQAGEKTIKRCVYCGLLMDVTGNKKKQKRLFHPSCGNNLGNNRSYWKSKAKEFYFAGKTLNEIIGVIYSDKRPHITRDDIVEWYHSFGKDGEN